MRPVEFRAYKVTKHVDGSATSQLIEGQKGHFHQWGINFEEFDSGPGQFTVAVIERQDGKVVLVNPEDVKFLDTSL